MDDTAVMTSTMLKRFKISATVILLILLILALIPLFVSLEQFRPEIEKNISKALGQEVKLGELQLHMLPVPKLRIASLQIGTDELKADNIDIYPRTYALIDKRIDIRHIRIKALSLKESFIEHLSQTKKDLVRKDQNDDPEQVFQLDHISIDELSVPISGEKILGPYELKVFLTKELMPSTAWLEAIDNSLRIDLKAKEKGYVLALKANNWRVPVGPVLKFQHLVAVGELNQSTLDITSFKGELYEGKLSGSALLGWKEGWNLIGKLESEALQLEPFLMSILDKPVIAGALTGKGSFSLQADEAANLGLQPGIQAEFLISDGVIYNADLEKATDMLSKEPVKGGQTPFSKLSGKLAMQSGAISLSKLDIKSTTLEATGQVDIAADETLNGVIEVGVIKTGSLVSMPIKVSGSMQDPSLRPTNEALVGGAVGTGLLGPGLGTALGVKAGNFLNKLFSSDEEKTPEATKEHIDKTGDKKAN